MIELTLRNNVESFIGNNIDVLEEVLNQRAQEYLTIQKDKEKYDFGQKINPDRLRELAGEVIKDTERFLDVNHSYPVYFSSFYLPQSLKFGTKVALGVFAIGTLAELTDGLIINDLQTAGLIALIFGTGTVLTMKQDHLNSLFDGSKKLIRIAEKKDVNAVGAIAHEYTHYLQECLTGLLMGKRNPIVEGHARGVEGIVANIFAQRYDNIAYIFEHIDRTAKELKDAYLFICEEKGIKPRESLVNLPIPKLRGFLYNFLGHHYSIGVAAMSIAQANHGDRIYRDVMRNDVSFLRL